jgi:hypothetical protein
VASPVESRQQLHFVDLKDISSMAKERGNREASVSRVLEYQISYDVDGTFRWTPPARSKELATALSYHYPEEKDMKAKMQAAIEEFLRDERKVAFGDANKRGELNATNLLSAQSTMQVFLLLGLILS